MSDVDEPEDRAAGPPQGEPAEGTPEPVEVTATDRVRALAEGRLGAADAAQVRAEIDADPALRTFHDDWVLVASMTSVADAVPPCTAAPPSVPAEAVDARRLRRVSTGSSPARRRLMPWVSAAAAALLAAAAYGLWSRDTGPVSLVAPELRGLLASAAGADPAAGDGGGDPALLARLASFEPAAGGRIAWIDDWETALALARGAGKPVLVYAHVEGCPYCAEFDRNVWPDAAVQAAAQEFVPARVDAMRAPERFADVFELDRWPYVAVIDADGETLHEFGGRRRAPDMRTQIGRGAEKAAERKAARPSWDVVRRASAALIRGDEARAEGRLGDALAAYRAAAAAAAGADVLPARISASRTRFVQGEARDALSRIVETARTDAARAASAADDAAGRFSGSAVGAEFGALARTLRETGKVPSFEEAQK